LSSSSTWVFATTPAETALRPAASTAFIVVFMQLAIAV